MTHEEDFPHMNAANHRPTSDRDVRYNCIAWAAGDHKRWWHPADYWPVPAWPEDDVSLGALERAYATVGYIDCGLDDRLEQGFEKIALYGTGGWLYTHAARQLASGKWTSKLGVGIDIEHDWPEVVSGGAYGEVLQIMKRPTPPPAPSPP